MRLFSGVIEAVDQARAAGGDAIDRFEAQVGWAKLLEAKPKVDALATFAAEDLLVSAADRYGVLLRFASTFFEHERFKAGTAAAPPLKSLAILRELTRLDPRSYFWTC